MDIQICYASATLVGVLVSKGSKDSAKNGKKYINYECGGVPFTVSGGQGAFFAEKENAFCAVECNLTARASEHGKFLSLWGTSVRSLESSESK